MAAIEPRHDTQRPHVLVIDDDAELCELLSLRLEQHGLRVST
jgi:DNA-binding response OmpR family regulator